MSAVRQTRKNPHLQRLARTLACLGLGITISWVKGRATHVVPQECPDTPRFDRSMMVARVRGLAKENGLGSAALAEALGIGRSTMANYWSGKRTIPTENLVDLAAILKTDVNFLLTGRSGDDHDRSPQNALAPQIAATIQHREDIKAAIRKRYGSASAFEAAKGLPKSAVHDVLRGKASERTVRAIAEELGISSTDVLRVTRPDVDRWICGGAERNFRFRKARTERQK